MTTNPKNYCVRPNYGLILPKSTCKLKRKPGPSDMQSNEKFMIQRVKASPAVTAKEVTLETFNKESGHLVEETKLRVTYVCSTTTNITSPPRTRNGLYFNVFVRHFLFTSL
uniref:Uncharacterized protein At2g23860 n=1 Tax=Arabidopsis thaliana TaxID=3702 RepID=O82215_ARATH|nr:unknown protein [Arabidopsis thaliana]